MAIDTLDQDACTGCGICVACCPMDVLRLDENTRKASIKYGEDCVACWSCESFCPVKCIDVSPQRNGRGMVSPY
jgi:NAD-dependent dihydropyrimidine dehydrogenase PreA subunit